MGTGGLRGLIAALAVVAAACGPREAGGGTSDGATDGSTGSSATGTTGGSSGGSGTGLDPTAGVAECDGEPAVCLPVAGSERCYCPDMVLVEEDVTRATVRDLHGDGYADVLVTSRQRAGVARLTVYVGTDVGLATTAWTVDVTGMGLGTPEVGDLDGDGIADVVADLFGDGALQVFLSGNSALLDAAGTVAIGEVGSAGLGDVDGDGNLDLVTAGCPAIECEVAIRPGNGDGTFGDAVVKGVGDLFFNQWTPSALADLNQDGSDDLVVAGLYAYLAVPGQLAFGNLVSTGLGPDGGDTPFAPDGSRLALTHPSSDGPIDPYRYQVVQAGADGTFTVVQTWTYPEIEARQAIWTDLDGDGHSDVLLASGPAGAVVPAVARNDGASAFPTSPPTGTLIPDDWRFAGTVDANVDGLPDLLVWDVESPERVRVYLAKP